MKTNYQRVNREREEVNSPEAEFCADDGTYYFADGMGTASGNNGSTIERTGPSPLTVRCASEILSMNFSPSNCLWANGYLNKGDPMAVCGPPSVGKSRFVMQMLIALILGLEFLGWKAKGRGTKWLLLQTENGNQRLQRELAAQLSTLSKWQREIIDRCLIIHTLENEEDSLLTLSVPKHRKYIRDLIEEFNPIGVVYDIFRDFGVGNLNSDEDMTQTLIYIGQMTRYRIPKRVPIVVHHALTGKAGASRAVGWKRTSYGRNSKVLLGWVARKSIWHLTKRTTLTS